MSQFRSFIWVGCLTLGCMGLGLGCARFESKPLNSTSSQREWLGRSLADPRLKAFLETNGIIGTATWPPADLDFETLTWVAVFYNPALEVARAQWAVATAGRTTASARPNPVVSVSPGYNFSAASGVSPWFPAVNVDLPIETAGKRGYRMARAAHLDEVSRLAVLTSAWQMRTALRTAMLEHKLFTKRSTLLGLQTESTREIIRLLEERLQAGAVSAPEVTTFKLALTRAVLDQAEAQRTSDAARRRVAETVGIPGPALDALLDPPIIPSTLYGWLTQPEALRDAALGVRSELLSLLAEYAASQSALQLEIARQYPDIHLGSGYQWDQGDHKWSLALTAELPLLTQNQGPIAEAEARRKEVAARFLAQQVRVLNEVDNAITQCKTSRSSLAEAESLVAAQASRSASVADMFKAGGADSLEVETSRLESIASSLVLIDARSRLDLAAGQLEDALQKPFPALATAGLIPHPQPVSGNR